MKRRAAASAFSALGLTGTLAFAEARDAPPVWSPGERTTSRLPGEAERRDERSSDDGVYGRFDAPFDLGLAAGAELGGSAAAASGRLSLHYFSMAGAYASYTDALGADRDTARLLSFGVDLQPAFIPRWSEDFERGPSFLDLSVDSISLGLGAYFAAPRHGSFGDARGFEASLGAGVPLAGTASGPWVRARGLLRWDDRLSHTAAAAALVALGWDWMLGG